MSIYSAVGRYAKVYSKVLNARTAGSMLSAGWKAGGVGGAARNLGKWAWGNNTLQRATRIGTMAGGGLLASH